MVALRRIGLAAAVTLRTAAKADFADDRHPFDARTQEGL